MVASATELDDALEASPWAPFAGEFDCVNAFDLFASFAMLKCAKSPENPGDAARVAAALARLEEVGLLVPGGAAGIEIRFCPLLNGTGLVPAPGRMLLDDGLRGMSADGLAEVMAHEFVHLRQFAARGRNGFKCDYVRGMSACGGCQDRAHPLEAPAYVAQDHARERLRRQPASQSDAAAR
ncbi:MAG: hypothetical protein AB7O21_07995 [Gammaproteobacteria bacterium]